MLHKVSDLSVAKMLAKLDIYTHAEYAGSPDKKISSMLLENVTSIKSISTSRTHPHAFEICEAGNPVLYFSAATLTETRLWASFLREIFNLNSLDTAGKNNNLFVMSVRCTRSFSCILLDLKKKISFIL